MNHAQLIAHSQILSRVRKDTEDLIEAACVAAMTDRQQAMIAEARRVSAGDWIVGEVPDRVSWQFRCRRCGGQAPFPDPFEGSALYCACDQARYDERAWREHFGVLAEIFG
jgi:hypothetical protein